MHKCCYIRNVWLQVSMENSFFPLHKQRSKLSLLFIDLLIEQNNLANSKLQVDNKHVRCVYYKHKIFKWCTYITINYFKRCWDSILILIGDSLVMNFPKNKQHMKILFIEKSSYFLMFPIQIFNKFFLHLMNLGCPNRTC